MKRKIQFLLQKVIGFTNYLFIFSIFRIFTLKFKRYESDIFEFIKMLKDYSVVLDIGANIGIITILLSKKIKKGVIYSFEPIPYNFKVLKKIVRFFRCKNVKLFNIALGDENKQVNMFMPLIDGVLMQGLSYVTDKKTNKEKPGLNFVVEQMKLDDIFEL